MAALGEAVDPAHAEDVAGDVDLDQLFAVDHQLVVGAGGGDFDGVVAAAFDLAHGDGLVAAAHGDLDGDDLGGFVALVGAGETQQVGVVHGGAVLGEDLGDDAAGGPGELDDLLAHVHLDGAVHAAAAVFLHGAGELGQGEARDLALPVVAVAEEVEVFQLAGECHISLLLSVQAAATRSAKSTR
ncbi:hypothetical protein AOR11_24275 [Vibrio alginolyticus]|nr:hypothetical protein AOR11_24275 [Vibrio alginolyticus]